MLNACSSAEEPSGGASIHKITMFYVDTCW